MNNEDRYLLEELSKLYFEHWKNVVQNIIETKGQFNKDKDLVIDNKIIKTLNNKSKKEYDDLLDSEKDVYRIEALKVIKIIEDY